ncbi:MAG: hypothetical protein LUD14_00005 [Clostridiales bacterium]|nr:hypothetical protein [Clostridiales bacterium]
MEKNEVEKVLKDTIEYANKEIKKSKKNMMIIGGAVLTIIMLILAYVAVFVYETPVNYQEGIVEVIIPDDKGIDIEVKMPNYKSANGILVKTDENKYDLYIYITQTLSTKIFKDSDPSNNLLRVGNGMIVDFQSQRLQGYLPDGNDETVIEHVYYINDWSSKISTMDDSWLIDYADKKLIWER